MSKHTPGPWYNCESLRSIRVLPASPAYERGMFSIAKYPMRTNKSLVSHEEWEANAHLIAAAPEMLSALENVERALKADYFQEGPEDRALKYIEEIQSVIRKAKNE